MIRDLLRSNDSSPELSEIRTVCFSTGVPEMCIHLKEEVAPPDDYFADSQIELHYFDIIPLL
ncbi:hypothetical protein BN903_118 [Halorubrum sp. AJ67]|nr:hypothetical protein BN903_118 [Halorubrum sp. AJ67]